MYLIEGTNYKYYKEIKIQRTGKFRYKINHFGTNLYGFRMIKQAVAFIDNFLIITNEKRI